MEAPYDGELSALAFCTCTFYTDTALTRSCPWCRGTGVVVVARPITEYVSGEDCASCGLPHSTHPAHEDCG